MQRLRSLRTVIALTLLLMLSSASVLVARSADAQWQAQYYNNKSLSGSPVLVRSEDSVNYNWGSAAPASGVSADNFSVRWTRTINFPAGNYRLVLTSDDGARLFVNDQLVLNQWYDHGVRTITADRFLSGDTRVRIEYYDVAHEAVVSFAYQRVGDGQPPATATAPAPAPTDSCSGGDWYASFWNNIYLAGPPAHTTRYSRVLFNWGGAKPVNNITADNFSASFTSMQNLPRGLYRFDLTADDSARLFVDNVQLLNVNGGARTSDLFHQGGPMHLRIEYFERTGNASLRFTCALRTTQPTRVPPTATPRPWIPPTATPKPPPPTPTPNPLYTANAGSCKISRVHVLNVRAQPNLTSPVVTQVRLGEVVTFTGNRSSPFIQIRTADFKIGWINGYYCGSGQSPTVHQPAPVHLCYVNVAALLVRAGPGQHYSYIEVLHRGEAVQLAGQRDASGLWVSVITPHGRRGWVYAPYIGVTAYQLQQLTVSGW